MKRSEIWGLEVAKVNQMGLQYCLLFVHKLCMNEQRKLLFHAAWATKPFGRVHESVFRHQGGQPRVSHRALDEKLTESTSFRHHNLVHSIRIAVYNKKYPSMVFHTKLWIT